MDAEDVENDSPIPCRPSLAAAKFIPKDMIRLMMQA